MGATSETRTSSPQEGANGTPTLRSPHVRDALLATAYASLPVVLLANLINGTLVAIIFAHHVPRPVLLAWYALIVVMSVIRFSLWHRYRRLPSPLDAGAARRWRRIAVAGSAASGVLWGAAGGFFSGAGGEMERLALGFILGGMGAGTVVALTPVMAAFYVFLVPTVLPFTLNLAIQGDLPHQTMAIACLVYLLGIILLGRRSHHLLTHSLLLRFQNDDLVSTLEQRVRERTDALEEINARLSLDIAERRRAEAALEQYAARQSAVARFGERALAGGDIEDLFAEALDLVRKWLDVPRTAILENTADGRGIIVRLEAGGTARVPGGVTLPEADGSPAGYALLTRKPVVSADLGEETRFTTPAYLVDGVTVSTLDVVITGGRQPYGVIEASDRRRRDFGAADVAFLESIANMLAAAIERKATEHNIQQLALRDPLTGLPNRALFRDQLMQALARGDRSGSALAILLLDLDHFKDVNDSLGHSAGDSLLVEVASRLRACTRQSEPPARLGGDEFALILGDLRPDQAAAVAAAVAQKIAIRLDMPFPFEGMDVQIGVSIGITLSPGDGSGVDQLMRNADLALYRAKSEQRGSHRFYSAEMSRQIERRKAIEGDLRRALADEQFELHYQPQLELAHNRIVGFEVLLRWRHPTRGLLRPADFLAVAEAGGVLGTLDRWVLEQACRHACECRRRDLPRFSTAVNVSPAEFRGDDLAMSVERISERFGCEPTWLELEVTEQLLYPAERADFLRCLTRLRGQGVKVAIEDFGTGYCNLARLRSLPVDRIKIDRTFLTGVGRDPYSEGVIRAIISLARNLGLEVAGEGVETEEQLEFLRNEGCDRAQGFCLGPPAPFDEFVPALVGTRP
jgi:diguanylate cyclase (GGDEF) domain